jgi:hypothetical protein
LIAGKSSGSPSRISGKAFFRPGNKLFLPTDRPMSPIETAADETADIVSRALPRGRKSVTRDDLWALVHPLALRSAEQAARIERLEREVRGGKEAALAALDAVLVEWVNER